MKRRFTHFALFMAFVSLATFLFIPVTLKSQTTIQYGNNTSASISALSETDIYRFNGSAGDIITIAASQAGNIFFAPRIELYTPAGTLLQAVSSNTSNPAARISALSLPQNGLYTILVLDVSGAQTGSYGLSLQRSSPGVGTAVKYGSTFSGNLAVSGYINAYTFNGKSGDVITALAGQTSNIFFAPQIEIYLPNGTLLQAASSTTSNPAARIGTVQLPQTGMYTVLILATGGLQPGDYGFTLEQVNPTTGPLITYGSTTSGSLAGAGDMNSYKFNGRAGDLLIITLGQASNIFLTPRLELYSPNGLLLQAVSGTASNPVARIHLLAISQTGVYTILAPDASGYQPGSYSLNLIAIVEATPLTWFSFKGQQQDKNIQLAWATTSEQNSKEFIVEFSLDGLKFTPIGVVPAAGNSTKISNYQYTNYNAVASNIKVLYYRLTQVDLDSRYTYSKVINIKIDQNTSEPLVSVYPNPFTRSITLQLKALASGSNNKVELYSSEGRLVYKRSLSNRDGASILLDDLPALSKGVYLLKGFLNEKLFNIKLIRND